MWPHIQCFLASVKILFRSFSASRTIARRRRHLALPTAITILEDRLLLTAIVQSTDVSANCNNSAIVNDQSISYVYTDTQNSLPLRGTSASSAKTVTGSAGTPCASFAVSLNADASATTADKTSGAVKASSQLASLDTNGLQYGSSNCDYALTFQPDADETLAVNYTFTNLTTLPPTLFGNNYSTTNVIVKDGLGTYLTEEKTGQGSFNVKLAKGSMYTLEVGVSQGFSYGTGYELATSVVSWNTAILPQLTVTSAHSTDLRSVSFDFSVSNTNILSPLTYSVYRSDQPAIDAASILIDSETIPTASLTIGVHTATTANALSLTPNAARPYVVIVANSDGAIHEAAGSVNTTSFRLSTSLTPLSLAWNNTLGGVNYSYTVGAGELAAATTISLYWSTSPSFVDALGGPISNTTKTILPGTAGGSYGPIHIQASQLQNVPNGAAYLLVVTDPNSKLGHFSDGTNVLAAQNVLFVPAGQLTFNLEGDDNPSSPYFSRQLQWPGGLSGVTIGRGYDLGSRTAATVIADMTAAGVPLTRAQAIAKGAALKGVAAQKFVLSEKSIIGDITWKQQAALFNSVYPEYVKQAKASYVSESTNDSKAASWSSLDPAIKDVLVDIAYVQWQIPVAAIKAAMTNNYIALEAYVTHSLPSNTRNNGRVAYLEKYH